MACSWVNFIFLIIINASLNDYRLQTYEVFYFFWNEDGRRW